MHPISYPAIAIGVGLSVCIGRYFGWYQDSQYAWGVINGAMITGLTTMVVSQLYVIGSFLFARRD